MRDQAPARERRFPSALLAAMPPRNSRNWVARTMV